MWKKFKFTKQVPPKDHILKHLHAPPPPPQRIQISRTRYSIIPYNEYTNNLHHYILPVYNIIIFIRDVEIIKNLICPVYKALYNTWAHVYPNSCRICQFCPNNRTVTWLVSLLYITCFALNALLDILNVLSYWMVKKIQTKLHFMDYYVHVYKINWCDRFLSLTICRCE